MNTGGETVEEWPIELASSALDATSVAAFRHRALENGYRLIRVMTGGKQPVARSWTGGESPERLLYTQPRSANTGMLCGGLRVIDLDVDLPAIVSEVVGLARQHLPKGPLVRRRRGSPRLALVFRAAEGQPGKCRVQGEHGAIEVLGAGQQLVIDGVHPSGAAIEWLHDRSPATVPVSEVPMVTEQQIAAFLEACRPIIAASDVTLEGNLPPRPIPQHERESLNNELLAGIEPPRWFDVLSPHVQREVIRRCLEAIPNQHDDPRDRWRDVLFSLHAAHDQGVPGVRELALGWSKRGASWTSEADFDRVWDSYRPGRVTIGTLLHLGRQFGADLSPFRSASKATPTEGAAKLEAEAGASTPSVAWSVSQLPRNPPKRQCCMAPT